MYLQMTNIFQLCDDYYPTGDNVAKFTLVKDILMKNRYRATAQQLLEVVDEDYLVYLLKHNFLTLGGISHEALQD